MVSNLIPWKKRKNNEVDVLRPRHVDPTYDLTRSMSDMVDHFFRRFDSEFGLSPWSREDAGFGVVPSVDVAETDDEVTVTADLPGLDEKDIKVTLDGDMLTLHGERKQEREEKKKNYYRSERSYGTFTRSIALPEGVDYDNVKATFKKGVLNVRIAKLPGTKTLRRHIPVQAG